ncbi:MAG: ExeM/NucH family extracellular endonuclease [Candidatus Promineifilaceae bacterium]
MFSPRKFLIYLATIFVLVLLLGTGLPAEAAAPGDVVINEIMQNPAAVADGSGEWLELYNTTGSPIDIDGWTIADAGADSHVINNGGPLLIPAGGFLVLGNNTDSGTNGGLTVDYSYGSSWFLANGDDEVILSDASATEIDRVEYDGGPNFPDPTGASMALADPALDNNVGANWCEASTPYGDGDLGTPGAANDCPVAVVEIVINEIMQNPAAVADGSGEWLELYNPTASDIDINGWTIADAGSDSHVVDNGGPLLVPAGGYVVLGNNTDTGTNGGVTVDYSYGSSWFLANGDDEVILSDASATEIDRVEYDGGPNFPDPTGASMALADPALDNNVGANWCEASTPYGDGDLGTPGAANDCPVAVPEVVINEIMQNPAAVNDDAGEWMELYNPTAGDIDINGWTIADAGSDSHVINNGGPLLIPAGGYLVLGNNTDTGTNGGVTVAYSYGSSWFLANGDDEVILSDSSLNEVDRVEYDGGPNFPDPTGASMALIDPTLDNNIGANWCEASTPYGDGDFGTPGAANDCGSETPTILINEVDADQVSTDSAEFVELFDGGFGNTDLSGLVIVLYNGSNDLSYGAFDLDGMSTDADGYFILCGDSANVPNCDLDVSPNTDLIQNGADAVALYTADASSFPTGTAVTTDNLVDALVYDTNDADDAGLLVLLNPGQPQVNEAELGDATTVSNQRCPNGSGDPRNTDTYAQWEPTPGTENVCMVVVPPLSCDDASVISFIHDIQGAGLSSPVAGSNVVIDGVVVGDFQNNASADSGDLNGFYVQEEDADADADALTSEGIFVFAPGADDVSTGDHVRVRGDVSEYSTSGGSLMTEMSNVAVAACSTPAAMPAATEVTFPVTAVSDLERYEGMFVIFPQALTISEYFNFDRFNETVLSLGRQYQGTAVAEPGAPANAVAAQNALARITLDDGRSTQNSDPAIHPNGSVFDLTNLFRGGDTVEGTTGVIDETFGLYRIQPTGVPTYTAANPREEPPAVGGSMKVASFNVLNYFTTLDTGSPICGPTGGLDCRGADNADEFTRQRTKILAALADIDADIFGLIELENHPTDAALIDLVGGLNDLVGAGTYDYVSTGTIGTDAIKVAFIYKTATVTPVGSYEILDSSVDPRFIDTLNRPTLAQTFMQNSNGAVLTVAVNHLKSKGSDCNSVGDPDTGDGQGNCNLTRVGAAQALMDWLATDPTGSGDPDFLLIGDYNAYDKEDPIDAILAGSDDTLGTADDYTDLTAYFNGEYAYSYVFDGQVGYLDHALGSASLTAQVTGVGDWHINSDEPDILDYNTDFKLPAQQALYEPNAFRSSDHDPAIIGLELGAAPTCSSAYPSSTVLFPVDHKFRRVFVLGVTDPDGGSVSITITGIYQDEAVDAPGSGNTSPDGKGVGSSAAAIRAERVGGGNGRVYHIYFMATDDSGMSCSGEVLVGVPASRLINPPIDDGALYDSTADLPKS